MEICLQANEWILTGGTEKWIQFSHLDQPVAVVTGGSCGLGQSIIRQLLLEYPNFKVINIDIISSPFIDERVSFYRCDLANDDEVGKMLKVLEDKFKNGIHLVINNAGIRLPYSKFQTVEELSFKKIFTINTLAPIKIISEIINMNKSLHCNSQCYIVNISSVLGILAPAKVSAYAASKGALISFHNSFSNELYTDGISTIRTLLVIPGQLDTSMFSGFTPPRQFFAPVLKSDYLAKEIIGYANKGRRGTLYGQLYTRFSYLLMSMPAIIQKPIRRISQIDECLPEGQ